MKFVLVTGVVNSCCRLCLSVGLLGLSVLVVVRVMNVLKWAFKVSGHLR